MARAFHPGFTPPRFSGGTDFAIAASAQPRRFAARPSFTPNHQRRHYYNIHGEAPASVFRFLPDEYIYLITALRRIAQNPQRVGPARRTAEAVRHRSAAVESEETDNAFLRQFLRECRGERLRSVRAAPRNGAFLALRRQRLRAVRQRIGMV
jgi:hypothetical protein